VWFKAMTVVLCLILLALCGCSAKDEQAERQSLHVAALSNPLTLNPLFVREAASAEVSYLLHSPLLFTDPETLDVRPGIVSAWEIGNDGRTYTLTMREDVFWSDGEPVTAEDVAFTLRVICHPDYTGWMFLFASSIEGASAYRDGHRSPFADGEIAGLRVLGDYALEIRLAETFAPFLSHLALAPLPFHLLGSVPVTELEGHAYSREAHVVNGPFRLANWRPEEYLHFQANLYYFLGQPKIRDIFYRIIPSQETQMMEFLAGRLDLLPTVVRVEDVALLQADPDVAVYQNRRLAYDYLGFNLRNGHTALSDRRVRQALSLVLDRQKIVENLLLGHGQVASGPLLPLHFAYEPGQLELQPDRVKAGKLLREADVLPLNLKLIYNAGNAVRENVALFFKDQAATVGVTVQVVVLEWEAFLSALRDGAYDLVILGRGADPDPDLSYHWHSRGPGNRLGYVNRQVDALLEAGNATLDRRERTRLYREAQRLILEDVPMIWLYSRPAIHAATSRLKNFLPHPETPFYHVHLWELGD